MTINWKDYVIESNDVYHQTYTSAVQSGLAYAIKRGFTTDDDEVALLVGSFSSRPGSGKTTKLHIPIYKAGKLQKKELHIQVYNRDTAINPFELNVYIS